jgi:hypothetical protein
LLKLERFLNILIISISILVIEVTVLKTFLYFLKNKFENIDKFFKTANFQKSCKFFIKIKIKIIRR